MGVYPFKLASREFHPADSVIEVGSVRIGGGHRVFIAGPCSVESLEQIERIGRAVQGSAHILRGGAYKPRTSPYSFQGLAEEGLKMLQRAGRAFGMPTVTEVVSTEDVDLVASYVDMLQIGARNMQNFALLRKVGAQSKPVLLKRGMAATVEELLFSAEYIMAEGNSQVVLCERGIRTFESYTRNTLDISAIPVIHKLSHLPVIVDPSHASGQWNLVEPLALAAMACGADGLMIEVHDEPDRAWSDGEQSLKPERYQELIRSVRRLVNSMEEE
jgi:3-deoxy-7-phosphoheptulonate synthase